MCVFVSKDSTTLVKACQPYSLCSLQLFLFTLIDLYESGHPTGINQLTGNDVTLQVLTRNDVMCGSPGEVIWVNH